MTKTWGRADGLALLLCGGLGLILAVLPHFAALWRHGTLDYLACNDDITYMAVARAPYYGESAAKDPFAGNWRNLPTLYSWLQFVPLAKLTRLLGLPLILMSLLWRVLGGLALGFSLYFLFRRLLSATSDPTAWALGCGVVCLSDAGLSGGRTIIDSLRLAGHLARGTFPMTQADGLPHLRVVQPLLHLPFLFMLVTVLLPGERKPARTMAYGAALVGVLILLNFYFWTAAAAALGFLLCWTLFLAWRAPQSRRASLARSGVLAAVLAGGLAAGSPQIYSNARTSMTPEYKEILVRLKRPFPLAPGDPARRWYVRNVWVWGKLAAGAAGMLYFGLPGLELLWSLTLAGYLFANIGLLAGLEFDNAHWFYVHAPAGEIMVLAGAAMLLDSRVRAGRERLRFLWLLPAGLAAVAVVWRPYEALGAPESAWESRVLGELRPFKDILAAADDDCLIAGPHEANAAMMYSRCAVLAPPILPEVCFISDEEVHERKALNAWLQGYDLRSYLKIAADNPMCAFKKPQWEAETVRSLRGAVFKRLLDGRYQEIMARQRPTFLLLPASAPAPLRAGPWRLARKDSNWSLWTRQ